MNRTTRYPTRRTDDDAGQNPLVSIVIPAYQARAWVCEAVDSALAQTYAPIEIIVVDDGSTDGTGQLLAARYGQRIRYVRQENAGLAAARNRGIGDAAGRYVQLLDADDLILPDKLAVQVDALQRHPHYTVAYSDFAYFRADPSDRERSHVRRRRRSGWLWRDLLAGNFIVVHAALVRRDVLLDADGFDERLGACEDYDLWLRLAAREQTFLYTPGVLALYRRTEGSMSSDRVRQIRATVAVLRRALDLRPLTARERATYCAFRIVLGGMSVHARIALAIRTGRQAPPSVHALDDSGPGRQMRTPDRDSSA